MGFVKGMFIGLLGGGLLGAPYMLLLRYLSCDLAKTALYVCFTENSFVYQILALVAACAILGGVLFKIGNI